MIGHRQQAISGKSLHSSATLPYKHSIFPLYFTDQDVLVFTCLKMTALIWPSCMLPSCFGQVYVNQGCNDKSCPLNTHRCMAERYATSLNLTTHGNRKVFVSKRIVNESIRGPRLPNSTLLAGTALQHPQLFQQRPGSQLSSSHKLCSHCHSPTGQQLLGTTAAGARRAAQCNLTIRTGGGCSTESQRTPER